MTDDRFKAWLTFWQFILGTVVLGLFSTVISHQIQTREVEIKEQEANAKFLEQALEEDIGVRRRLAQYFSHVTRSAELRERWGEYSKIVEAEFQQTLAEKNRLEEEAKDEGVSQEAREQLLARVAQLEQELSPRASKDAALPTRTYLHISNEDQRGLASAIAAALREASIMVPGIELQRQSPSRSELRYFRRSEEVEAEGIAAIIQGVRPGIEARYIPGYENATGIRPRHFELWIGTEEQP
ncbi:hypothetical protein [Marinobacterium aestuariivivens]|uniref:Uncharacterized protein n=1 Tax=Marinobacterium aestuariivivens TaxID=1698799 RepID=A0ABW2A4F6_9GAMM